MKETEPVRVLREAALKAVGEATHELRERGWDAHILLEAAEPHEDHFCDVGLKIRVGHSMPIPMEARLNI